MKNLVQCEECKLYFSQITLSHVKSHGFQSIAEYLSSHSDAIIFSDNTLNKRRKSHYIQIVAPVKTQQYESNLCIPSHRTKDRISYESFLLMLKQGMSLKSMISTGVSKHQIAFYSNMAQCKIKISRTQFIDEYNSGKSLKDIAKQHDINHSDVGFLREFFGVKRLGHSYIKRKAN